MERFRLNQRDLLEKLSRMRPENHREDSEPHQDSPPMVDVVPKQEEDQNEFHDEKEEFDLTLPIQENPQFGVESEAVGEPSSRSSDFCIIEMGKAFYEARNDPEETARLERKMIENCSGKWNVNLEPFYKLMEEGTEEEKVYAAGMIGMVKMLTALNKKLSQRKVSSEETLVKVFYNNFEMMDQKKLIIQSVEGVDIDVNDLFFAITAGTFSVKTIVHVCAERLLKKIMPESDLVKYSMSIKPRPPQLTLPDSYVNGPIALISRALKSPGLDYKQTIILVSTIYRTYMGNKFNLARTRKNKENEKAQKRLMPLTPSPSRSPSPKGEPMAKMTCRPTSPSFSV